MILRAQSIALILQEKSSSSKKGNLTCNPTNIIATESASNTNTTIHSHVEKAWQDVVDFVIPLLSSQRHFNCKHDNINDNINTNTLHHLDNLYRVASKALIMASWMIKGYRPSKHISREHLELATSLLLPQESELQKSKRINVLSTIKSDHLQKDLEELTHAHQSGTYQLFIGQFVGSRDSNNSNQQYTSFVKTVTEHATSSISRDSSSASLTLDAIAEIRGAPYGTAFLQFLLCWSGLHRSPWPFVTITQARDIVKKARESLNLSLSSWGRNISFVEESLLRLGEADAEGGQIPGGFLNSASDIYRDLLKGIDQHLNGLGMVGRDDKTVQDEHRNRSHDHILELMKAHCLSCLSSIALSGNKSLMEEEVEKFKYNDFNTFLYEIAQYRANVSLNLLKDLQDRTTADSGTRDMQIEWKEETNFYIWHEKEAFATSLAFQLCRSRRLVAQSLLRAGNPSQAQKFLDDAVKESPFDYDAAFSLGAFSLQMALYEDHNNNHDIKAKDKKKAQIQLLKAAKLDSNMADPFALLGIWYELQNDRKRAVGCHSKALLIEPSHAVAGRGMLRLRSFRGASNICEAASNVISPENGWAWYALGRINAMDGLDDEAVLCYQQALRCQDTENSSKQILGIFYKLPCSTNQYLKGQQSHGNECSEIWSQLAGCYRILGKYSASLRAYSFANEYCSCNLPDSIICAWAHVELELGLYDDAARKFDDVLSNKGARRLSVQNAVFGFALCMAAIARRDLEEGKFGSSYSHIKVGAASLENMMISCEGQNRLNDSAPFGCALKLLGDLYSFCSNLPSSVFDLNECNEISSNGLQRAQNFKKEFVAQGESFFHRALLQAEAMSISICDEIEQKIIISSASCDLGTNLMLQARIICDTLNEGCGGDNTTMVDIPLQNKEVKKLLEKAKMYFEKAIDTYELSAQAWCGLGCVLCSTDPVLAQHAFCRAIQIDKSFEDAWSNIAMLYIEYGIDIASEEAIDALTQVSDTPLMWIGRGLLLEKAAKKEKKRKKEELFCQAADAYRTALQVGRNPQAKLGLSLTCRRLGISDEYSDNYTKVAHSMARKESYQNLAMYADSSDQYIDIVSKLQGIMLIEEGSVLQECGEMKAAEKIFIDGSKHILRKCGNEGISNSFTREDESSNHLTIKKKSSYPVDELKLMSTNFADKYFGQGDFKPFHNESIETSLPKPMPFSQREILENPDDGGKWLQFTKSLLTTWTGNEMEDNDNDFDIILSAISRAKAIFKNQVAGDDLSQPPNACLFSEALSLSTWIKNIGDYNDNDGDDCSEDTENVISLEQSFDLQKSLLLDPENRFARAYLTSNCPYS